MSPATGREVCDSGILQTVRFHTNQHQPDCWRAAQTSLTLPFSFSPLHHVALSELRETSADSFLDTRGQEEGKSDKKSTAEPQRAASDTFIRLGDAVGRTDPP